MGSLLWTGGKINFLVRFGREMSRRFGNYRTAERFLTGLRYMTDEGTFDLRDYRSDNPLGFSNLVKKWLSVKRMEVRPKSYNSLANYLGRAEDAWEPRSIREIGYAEIEDLILSQVSEQTEKPLSQKSRANMRSALHDFWN